MNFNIRTVETNADADIFTDLPYRLYRTCEQWVPPVRKSEANLFVEGKNPALSFCDVRRWIVLDSDDVCVGRVAAIVNREWNAKTGEKIGRISRFECIDNAAVARLLLGVAEDWLREKGMQKAAGPLGFSNLDQQGLTTLGFDKIAALGSNLTMDYYRRLFEAEGYEPMQTWDEFRITVPFAVPPKVTSVAKAARVKYGLRLKTFSSLDELRQLADSLMTVFNRSFEPLFGTYPFSDEMKRHYVDRFMDFLDHRLVVAALDDRAGGVPVGFIVCMPSVVRQMRDAWGDIGLFDAAKLWLAMRRSKEAEVLLAAVLPEARMRGAFALMMECLIDRMAERGIRYVETTAILTNNDRASSTVKEFTHERHKQKMCLGKRLQ